MNIFDLPNLPRPEEVTDVLAGNGTVRIERIISTGQISDWYDQEEREFVVLCEGEAELEFDNGERIVMARGDTLLIPAHQRHRVSRTSSEPPCIWLCFFY